MLVHHTVVGLRCKSYRRSSAEPQACSSALPASFLSEGCSVTCSQTWENPECIKVISFPLIPPSYPLGITPGPPKYALPLKSCPQPFCLFCDFEIGSESLVPMKAGSRIEICTER
jgi:hypothetical protein